MMEKLVILSDGVVRKEILLNKKELSIGRDPNCDVYLDDPLVSRQHAKMVQIFEDYFLEDLESTNGTLLNHRKVSKHVVRQGDILKIGSYELRVLGAENAEGLEASGDELDKTVSIRPKQAVAKQRTEIRGRTKPGWVRHLGGPNKGETVPLNKSLVTIGRPGEKVAVITRRPQGFFLLHLGGDSFPALNGKPVKRGGVELHHGDIIEIDDTRVQVFFGEQP
jgi:pSer/pThr/pTyr-binding forkhead associated (FHA) protein